MMSEIALRTFETSLESRFKVPVLFKEAGLDNIARKCLDSFAVYGLRTSQIVFKGVDELFNYELSVSLFNGNATFKLTSEKVGLTFQSVVTKSDFEVIGDCTAKIYENILSDLKLDSTQITVNMHATFQKVEAHKAYFDKYADHQRKIVSGGQIIHYSTDYWPENIRLAVDQSVMFPDGVFLILFTKQEDKPSHDSLKSLTNAFIEGAGHLGLTFPQQ